MMANWISVNNRARMRRLALLPGLVGMLSVWGSGADFASPPLVSPYVIPTVPNARPEKDPAFQVLRRALVGSQQTLFSGEQTILNFDEGDGSACVTQETHLGPNRYSISYQNPPDARGRLQIAEAGWFQQYLPQTHTLIKRQLTPLALTASDVTSRLDYIRQNYFAHLASQTEDTDGRTASILEILPRRKDRPRQKLWIDSFTGLILRRETYSPSGVQTSATFWRNLRFYPAMPAGALRWTPPEGTQTEEGICTLPHSESRIKSVSWAAAPDTLGDSFHFVSSRPISARGAQGLYCNYSDGLCTVSFIQLAGFQSFQTAGGILQPLPLSSDTRGTAQITSRGSLHILSWRSAHKDATYSLIGELTEEALMGLARSLP